MTTPPFLDVLEELITTAFRKGIAIERHFPDAPAAVVMAPTTDALQDLTGRAPCDPPLFG